jgi:ribonucleoside-triphosphate reductase (formate)
MVNYKGVILTHCPIHPCELDYRYSHNIHGHCVDEDTEILTKNGWKKYSDVCIGDIIYSYNPGTNILEYDSVESVIINPDYKGSMFHLQGKGIDMLVTDEHRVPYRGNNGTYKVSIAKDFFKSKIATIYKSFLFNNKGVELDDNMLRLYIYLAADGSLANKTLCRFNLKKERKIVLVRQLLDDMALDYSENRSGGHTRFNFQMPKELYNWRIKGLDLKLLNSNRAQATIIRQSYSETDGSGDLIFTSKAEEVDILQQLFILNGFSCKVHSRKGHGFSKNTSYQLSVVNKTTQTMPRINERVKVIENFNRLVWCITCKNGNFIARRHGGVFLTGNCHEKLVEKDGLPDERYVNVSCEVRNYTPKPLTELI